MIKKKNQLISFGLSALLCAVPVSAFAEVADDKDISEKKVITTDIYKDNENNSDIEGIKNENIKQYDNNSGYNLENKTEDFKNNPEEEKDDNTYNVGWIKNSDGTYSLYDGLGDMVKSSWCKVGGKWYYLNDNGIMATGWVKNEGSYYYVGQLGNMHTGWIKDGGLWYYLDEDGIMQKGWIYNNGAWYYLNEYGAMVTNAVIDGYTLGSDGRCN